MPKRALADWLAYQEQLHPSTIDLGLERLSRVLERLSWNRPQCPVITVGGTNGKGSCVALLESILSAAGYRVGTFTSPHLIRYNERIRVEGREATDAELVDAFEQIDAARGEISLTFFEFNALAAFLIFAARRLDVIILEVGLGGRLDAVNVIDADVAIVASVALDHCDWLGDNVEAIGREKAGIFRSGRPAIYGSPTMPLSIASEAERLGADLRRIGVDFDFSRNAADWTWRGGRGGIPELTYLPFPALSGAIQLENCSAVLCALDALAPRIVVERAALEAGLRTVKLPGRFQILKRKSEWILDVAHNPAAAQTLADNLSVRECAGKTIAVCGMFADKDVPGVIEAVRDEIDEWIIAGLNAGRAMSANQLAGIVESKDGRVLRVALDIPEGCSNAESIARDSDRIVVFGSFHAVGPALEWLARAERDR